MKRKSSKLTKALLLTGLLSSAAWASDQTSVYVLEFETPALLEHHADNKLPALNNGRKLNLESTEAKSYLKRLETEQSDRLSDIRHTLNRAVDYKFQYQMAQNGAALELTPSEAAKIAQLPGVKSVQKDKIYHLDTDAGPNFIGADSVWDGTNVPRNFPNKGEGVIIGVLDTGINGDHPSFSDNPEDGYDFAAANPKGAGNFLGACAGASPTYTCNNKLIGAWDFADDATENDGPEDSNGHGTHTAGTAAGNAITAPAGGFVDSEGSTLNAPSLSGVAPHAHIIAYDVCTTGCSGAAISAGINQAITDGVDVINFSISGGRSPWSDGDRLFLNAYNAGIVVSASAGNTRDGNPNPETDVNHLGPWLLTVANSTHNRANSNNVDITGPGTVPAHLVNLYGLLGAKDNFTGDVNSDIVYAGTVDSSNFEGCSDWTGTPFTGKVALISRGTCTFADKINKAATAGATAVIVFNNQAPVPIVMGGIEGTTIPAVMIGQTDGNNIVSFLSTLTATATVKILGTPVYSHINAIGNILNKSSLSGPNLNYDITKPDINGPGTNIFAAYKNGAPGQEWAFLTGTSMSAPHIAGAAALIVSAHPSWSPSEVKSAIMLTAKQSNKKPNGTDDATADQVGSGTVDLTKALKTGLVMDETYANYLAADPSLTPAGDPKTLNIPSVRNQNCDPNCSWSRNLKSTRAGETIWDITTVTDGFTLEATIGGASSFTFPDADKIYIGTFESTPTVVPPRVTDFTLNITASNVPDINNGMAFGQVILTERNGNAPPVHITVTVNKNAPPASNFPQ